ncbi:MAG: putative diguanylate cyclase AdrA [Firmicutes bacterium ADurb.Bin373]|nr:GGDEF domain-containing protein [Bacillota bacterium]OQA07447.1 MAG: putative diguanylate cyclase AdrA [Firmicutes bacterium ADurb.Bin373]
MRLSQEEYKLIVDFSPNMIWRAGLDAKCNFFNKTWLEFTGRTIEQEVDDGWAEGVHPEDYDRCLNIYLTSFKERKGFEMVYRLRNKEGEYRWINDIGIPIYHDNGDFAGFIGSCVDVTDRVEGERLKKAAQIDGLTGLNNRQHFDTLYIDEFEKAVRYKTSLSVIVFDLDEFKSINDQYGHFVGDLALKHLSRIIGQTIREHDICGRYGGDEFIIVLPHADAEQANLVAERLRNNLATNPLVVEEQSIKLTASFGVVQFTDNIGNALELFKLADKALYQSKQKGRNQVTVNSDPFPSI